MDFQTSDPKMEETQYQQLLNDIVNYGYEKETRNGKTKALFGKQIMFTNIAEKFPLLTTKHVSFKNIFY